MATKPISTISSIFESLDLIQTESERNGGTGQGQSAGAQAKRTSTSEAAQLLQERKRVAGSGQSAVKLNRNKTAAPTSAAFSMVSASTVATPKYWGGGSSSKKGRNKKGGVKAEGIVTNKKKMAKLKGESYADKRERKQAKKSKVKGR